MNDTTKEETPMMTGEEYKTYREQLGSQQFVGDLLGVDIRTIQRREASETVVYESALAIKCAQVLKQLQELEDDLPATRTATKTAIGSIIDLLK